MAVVRALALLLLLFGVCFKSTLASDGLIENFGDLSSGHLRHRQRSLLQATPPAATPTPPPAIATPPPAIATPPPAATPPAATPPAATPPAATPPAATPPAATPPAATPPGAASPPTVAPPPTILPPSPPPRAPPAPPTPVRVYLMWIGIGAAIVVLAVVAVICLCRKFGQNKIRGAQRLPPLPRYH